MQVTTSRSQEWVPLTPDIFDSLYAGYINWLDDLDDIRERMVALRDEARIGWQPPSDIKERLNDLTERDRLYAAKHMDSARIFLDAAEADASATKAHRLARIERLKERIAVLTKAYDQGWPKYETFTKEESMAWCGMFWSLRFYSGFIDDTEAGVEYFEAKLYRLYQQYVGARNSALGLNQKPKMQLGLKLLGKKVRGK